MSDQQLTCIDCGDEFQYTEREQEFFAQNQWPPPKRCKGCRLKKKERDAQRFGS